MNWQNLVYALTQVAHNFGAVAVVAGPLYFLINRQTKHERRILWLTLVGWVAQIASGTLFGLVSLYFYSQLPDIHGIAIVALAIKIACAIMALVLIALLLHAHGSYADRRALITWQVLTMLAIVALTAAAFLRWYS
ncbi:hypothetical protein [Castellaniella sp.]|uniref:hypothetical protein n=2 Tax=Castellaniella sp. TaxID=1955812 RepID=UPI002AFECDDD|nr:hypothetical protein [Castellaniella sp.]